MEDFNLQFLGKFTENILISIGIFLLLGVEIWLINKASSYLKRKVDKMSSNILKIQSFELVSLSKQKLLVNGVIKFIRILAILMGINFSLLLTLGLFPRTKVLIVKYADYKFDPMKQILFDFLDYLPNLFSIIIIVIIFRFLFKLNRTLAREIENETIKISAIKPIWARTTAKIINFILLAFMLIFIMPLMPGYESLAFKGVATFLAALITLGGSSVIANFMAGIVISYMNPCKVGDWIQLDDSIGKVIEMSQFAIKIETAKNVIISIPYAKGLSSHIINYSGDKEGHRSLLHTTVNIDYKVTWEKVNELLLSAASLTESIDQSVPSFVRQLKLDDFYVVYELNAYTTDVHNTAHIYSELHKNVLNEFRKAEIEILSPHYEVGRNYDKPT